MPRITTREVYAASIQLKISNMSEVSKGIFAN